MILLYVTIAAFAVVVTIDFLCEWLRDRAVRLGTESRKGTNCAAAGSPRQRLNLISAADHGADSRVDDIRAAYTGVGAELEGTDFAWPSRPANVHPLHHRRSMAHPPLRIVPVDKATADHYGLPFTDQTPAA